MGDEWELDLYHKNKAFLIKATEMIAAGINDANEPKWKVNIGK